MSENRNTPPDDTMWKRVDTSVINAGYDRPLKPAEANTVLSALTEVFDGMEKTARRKLVASIFHYLTRGSKKTTHNSGKPEGGLKSVKIVHTRQRHHRKKTYR